MTQTSTTHAQVRLTDSLPDETLLKWLHDMQLIREFETRTMQAYQQAKIGGFCHIYSGQEASAVGTLGCVEPDDPVVLAYRDHGHALARGMSPQACMAEMFGRIKGCAKGKGGSMHMFDKPHWLFGGHGIVGAQTPLGAGLAFGARYEWEVLGTGKKKVALCYLGDGAVDQGAFHEALNLASILSLPVIYIIENNGYSMGTAIKRHTANSDHLTSRGEAYGIKSIAIDGFDILNVHDKFKPFVDDCREMQRPGFVDFKTYRYLGHSLSDPQKYRTREEVESYKEKDSIASLVSVLMKPKNEGGRESLTEEGWKAMRKEISNVVKEAIEYADQAPIPEVDKELYSDVYIHLMPQMSPAGEYVMGQKNPLL